MSSGSSSLKWRLCCSPPPGWYVLNEVTLACRVHSTGRQSTGLENGCIMGSWGSFCACLVRTQPWLTLACVDRTFSTAGSAPVVDTAWRMVAPGKTSTCCCGRGGESPGGAHAQPAPRGRYKALLGLSCQFLGLMLEDPSIHLGFPAVGRATVSAA